MRIDEYLFTKDTIALQVPATDWKEAVARGVQLLEDAGAVGPGYYDAILANVAAHGPYFVLVPGVAMPHARPENGAWETSFSLVTLERPVDFGHADHDPVSVVLCVAAADHKALNQDVIAQAMLLLGWGPFVERMREARTRQDIREIFECAAREEGD